MESDRPLLMLAVDLVLIQSPEASLGSVLKAAMECDESSLDVYVLTDCICRRAGLPPVARRGILCP